TKTSVYARTELGYTEHGDPSYETGVAFGAPIVEDKVGFRVSAWFRRDGGWVDRDDWSRASLATTPATAPTPGSVTTVLSPNSNWQNSAALKAALTFAPIDGLTITPSIYYQRVKVNDTQAFWSALSNPDSGQFVNGNALNALSNDHFYLPALKVEWAFSNLRLVSNTSYFNRDSEAINDYSAFETALWGQTFTGLPFLPPTQQRYLNGPYYPKGSLRPRACRAISRTTSPRNSVCNRTPPMRASTGWSARSTPTIARRRSRSSRIPGGTNAFSDSPAASSRPCSRTANTRSFRTPSSLATSRRRCTGKR